MESNELKPDTTTTALLNGILVTLTCGIIFHAPSSVCLSDVLPLDAVSVENKTSGSLRTSRASEPRLFPLRGIKPSIYNIFFIETRCGTRRNRVPTLSGVCVVIV